LATATQPAQNLETQTPPKVVIRINSWIREMAAVRGMSDAAYLVELARADYAEFRAKRLCATGMRKAEKTVSIKMRDSHDPHRTKLSPEDVQRVLFLADKTDSERLSLDALASRMRVSKSTIRRILKAHERLVPSAPRPRHGQRWCDSGGGPR